MNYKLLVESWRKFLNEEPYDDNRGLNPPSNISKVIDFGDRDPTSWDPEREKLRAKMQKDQEMLDVVNKLANQPENAFPIVNGKNFDQFVKPGTELVAIADGVITTNNTKTYDQSVEALARLINARRDKGLLINDINISMNGTVASYRDKKLKDRADDRQRKLDKFNNKFSSDSQIKDAPGDWTQMRRWANFHLGAKLMPTLLRYYNRSRTINYYPILPTKGLGFTLIQTSMEISLASVMLI